MTNAEMRLQFYAELQQPHPNRKLLLELANALELSAPSPAEEERWNHWSSILERDGRRLKVASYPADVRALNDETVRDDREIVVDLTAAEKED